MTHYLTTTYQLIVDYPFIALFVIYIFYDRITRFYLSSALDKIGKQYCEEREYIFVKIKACKSHYSIVYKTPESGKRRYTKIRLHTFFNRLKRIEWLD